MEQWREYKGLVWQRTVGLQSNKIEHSLLKFYTASGGNIAIQ